MYYGVIVTVRRVCPGGYFRTRHSAFARCRASYWNLRLDTDLRIAAPNLAGSFIVDLGMKTPVEVFSIVAIAFGTTATVKGVSLLDVGDRRRSLSFDGVKRRGGDGFLDGLRGEAVTARSLLELQSVVMERPLTDWHGSALGFDGVDEADLCRLDSSKTLLGIVRLIGLLDLSRGGGACGRALDDEAMGGGELGALLGADLGRRGSFLRLGLTLLDADLCRRGESTRLGGLWERVGALPPSGLSLTKRG